MAQESVTDDFIRSQIGSTRVDLPGWITEVGQLVELARNAERTGVPPDPRTVDRARTMVVRTKERIGQFQDWEGRTKQAPLASELRILKATMAAVMAEAEIAAKALKIEV